MAAHFFSRTASLTLASVLAAAINPVASHAADMPMQHDMAAMTPVAPASVSAIAVLVPTQGNDVHGTVRFTKVANGVRVVADLTGLKPGDHGFHVHEFGDASSTDGAAAGGHFNPAKDTHGAPTADHRHEGDLGNIKADATGHATLDYVDTKLSFDGAASIIGHGVVIHANADDLTTQPTGNAGGRLAVGVIGLAKGA